MKKPQTQTSDFFDRFHASRARLYVVPGIFGMLLAFGIVSLSHTTNMGGLMANVANVAAPQYQSDLVLHRTAGGLEVLIGKSAQAVDTIEFRLLSDPTDQLEFSPDIGTVTPEGDGMVQYVRSFDHKDLPAGTVIARFSHIQDNQTVAITDAEFVSGDSRYSLSTGEQ